MSSNCSADLVENVMAPAISESLSDTFSNMVFLPLTLQKPIQKQAGKPLGYISGTIGISGRHDGDKIEVRGNIALIFPEPLAAKIFRGMMMMGPDDQVDIAEVKDAIGEITNMTAGGAKTRLAEKGYKLSISLPTVIVGHDHYLDRPTDKATSLVIPAKTENEEFFMEVCFS